MKISGVTMNVCFVLISDGWGGGENIVRQTITSLIEKDINVSIIINNEIKEYFEDLNVRMLNLGSLFDSKSLIKMILNPNTSLISVNPNAVKFLNILLIFIYFYRVKKRIRSFLTANKVDIIHSHIEYSDILCYIFNKPHDEYIWLSNIHGPWFSLFNRDSKFSFISNFFIIKYLKKAFKKMSKIVFVSKYLYEEFKQIFGDLITEKGVIILNGINTTNINKQKSVNLKEGFNILFPGGPKLIKGGDILIKAVKDLIKEIPELNLYIALEVPPNSLIRQLVKDYSLENHVNFVGFLKPDKYMAFLNSMDLLVMPSRREAFGVAYLEAMALGVPIVASNVGGGAEIIKDNRNGILTSPDPHEVTNAILTLYNDDELRERISKNNLHDIHNYEWALTVENYIVLYNKLIKK